MKWNEYEISRLREIFPKTKRGELTKYFNTTWQAIERKAYYLGFEKIKQKQTTSQLEILLEDTNLTMYWMGFLMADGHFSKREEISLQVAIKDKEHVEKLCNFLHSKIRYISENMVGFRTMDKKTVPQIKIKFDLNNRKTYIPPKISVFENLNNNQLISWYCGFIDGDGNIRKIHERQDCTMQLTNYKTWRDVHQYILDRLFTLVNIKSSMKIHQCSGKSPLGGNKENHIRFAITNNILLKLLKNKTKELNLPVLDRKWKNIDEFRETKIEKYQRLEKNIIDLLKTGKKRREIAQQLNLKISTLHTMMLRKNISRKTLLCKI